MNNQNPFKPDIQDKQNCYLYQHSLWKFQSVAVQLLALCLVIALNFTPTAAWSQGQFLSATKGDATSTVEIPSVLTPAIIDGLLSRLTDAQVRTVLREDMERQAAEQAIATADEIDFIMLARQRLSIMAERIATRTTRWADRIANLDDRLGEYHKRIARAQAGFPGMVIAAALLITAGFAAGALVTFLTRKLRASLVNVTEAKYWTRLSRTVALGLVEMLPIFAFQFATQQAIPSLEAELGPLMGMTWIYTNGVWWSWVAILLSRRVFAPELRQIRITSLTDNAACNVHARLHKSVLIGLAGWLLGGVFLNLGFGFPPAIVSVALAGASITIYLVYSVVRNYAAIQKAAHLALEGREPQPGAPLNFVASILPWAMSAYIFCIGTYWLLHWLERGQHQLYGPLGTLIVFLTLPIFDRLGGEIISSFMNTSTAAGQRYKAVLHSTWRIFYGSVAIFIIFGFWGISLLNFAKGAQAPVWASAGFDIVITMLIGYMIWRLIKAALHTEARTNIGDENVDPDAPPISRLDTLVPLFRNVLLGLLAIIVLMISLSAIGVDIGLLIASAGVVGIAIGFGAQTLVRDIFSGIFFLADDAFRVGEYIELDKETRGEVESISIRSLQLRHHRGAVITIPFGELKKVTNHNREWVIYKMPFRMEPDTDPMKFKKLVKMVGAEFMAHPEHGPKFIEPLKSQGVYYVDDDSALVMRVKFKCLPRAQFVIRREIYHRLRTVFAENDLKIARRKVEVVGPDGNMAGAVIDEVDPPKAAAT
ncbi:MAG: mechanosensitive ion channel family protein [Amylibacter sp.]|nr:mechanosensitive ion channel family protein [Amylibacter sp.]